MMKREVWIGPFSVPVEAASTSPSAGAHSKYAPVRPTPGSHNCSEVVSAYRGASIMRSHLLNGKETKNGLTQETRGENFG